MSKHNFLPFAKYAPILFSSFPVPPLLPIEAFLPVIRGKNDSVTEPKLLFTWFEFLNMDEPKIVTGRDFEFPMEFW